jgi:hypothetical protein
MLSRLGDERDRGGSVGDEGLLEAAADPKPEPDWPP